MARPRKDETGKRYGKWTVISAAENDAERSLGLWLVRCDCGLTDLRDIAALRNGKSKGCYLCHRLRMMQEARSKREEMAPIVKVRDEMFDLLKKLSDGKVDPKEARKRATAANRALRGLKPRVRRP